MGRVRVDLSPSWLTSAMRQQMHDIGQLAARSRRTSGQTSGRLGRVNSTPVCHLGPRVGSSSWTRLLRESLKPAFYQTLFSAALLSARKGRPCASAEFSSSSSSGCYFARLPEVFAPRAQASQRNPRTMQIVTHFGHGICTRPHTNEIVSFSSSFLNGVASPRPTSYCSSSWSTTKLWPAIVVCVAAENRAREATTIAPTRCENERVEDAFKPLIIGDQRP